MKLAALGSNCIDYYTNLNGGTAFAGGGPVNMAAYTKRLGGEASYIGPVGNDAYGSLMISQLNAKGINTSHVRIESGRTAVSEVRLDGGERTFGEYDEGVMASNHFIPSDLSFVETHDMVVCDVWGHMEGSLRLILDAGIPVAFDCADRPDDPASLVAIENSNYIFFSSDAGDSANLREQMKAIAAKGPDLVIAMLGSDGSLCFDGETYYKFGLVPVEEVVDTMGAGDSYIAGFLTGRMKGLSILECMQLGAATASETISYFGAWH